MKQTTGDNAADTAILLAPENDNVVLYADDTILVFIWRDDEGSVRHEVGPSYVIESMIARGRFAWADADALGCDNVGYRRTAEGLPLAARTEPSTVEWNGRHYLTGSLNIEENTPVDQSDLTYPGAIAARTPEMYQPLDTLLNDYRNPDSQPMRELLDSIRRRDESERDQKAAVATAADNS
jgi:hypothetical protein